MKQKLLKVMIAFIAIVMPNLSYAQSQEAAGTYNGTSVSYTHLTLPTNSLV